MKRFITRFPTADAAALVHPPEVAAIDVPGPHEPLIVSRDGLSVTFVGPDTLIEGMRQQILDQTVFEVEVGELVEVAQ